MTVQTPPLHALQSFKNRYWKMPDCNQGLVEEIINAGANPLIAPILAARGITPDQVSDFLNPSMRQMLPNPDSFIDMDKAANRLVSAILKNEKITIFTDYDVDGATSAATLGRFLRDCGFSNFSVYVPDRIKEGYGPNAAALLRMAKEGNTLVIILDAGTTAFDALDAIKDEAMDILVIDHHAAEERLPEALALVNPNRLDQEKGFGHLCAAGMTFLFCIAVRLRLRKIGYFDGQQHRPAEPPNPMTYLDLVALGTICDVVPLTGLNRAYVTRGIPYLSSGALPGIEALKQAALVKGDISPRDCGFGLGPRINAGGRIGESDLGTKLLLTINPDVANGIAKHLDILNRERQDLEKEATEQAMSQVIGRFIPGTTRKIAIAIVEAHEGVVGITAARLKEALDAPAFVITPIGDDTLKGSGRSVPGFDLGAAIIEARNNDLLVAGGGHAMAGGITIKKNQIQAFTEFLDEKIAKSEYFNTGVISSIDAIVPINRASLGLVDAIQDMAPFGTSNPTPSIMLQKVLLSDVRILKDKHVKCSFQDPDLMDSGLVVDGIIWNAAASPIGDKLLQARRKILDILGSLEINEWNGRRRVQIMIEDARFH